jgi:hypothetical protein
MPIKPNSQQGIAILYAVLLTTIILTIGLILSDIITKQIVLSSIGKNSQTAYYAATLGKECALYWDQRGEFGYILRSVNGSLIQFEGDSVGGTDISCAGSKLDETNGIERTIDDFPEEVAFTFDLDQPESGSCARVEVKKKANPSGDTNFCRGPEGSQQCANTVILSSGYNVRCAVLNSSDTIPIRTVERTLQIQR